MDQRQKAIFDYLGSVERIDTLDALNAAFSGVVAPYGFTHFACTEVARPGFPALMRPLFGSVTDEWVRRYRERNYHMIDPALRTLLRSTQAFTWSEAEATSDDPRVRTLFGEAREVRADDALVTPVHGAQGHIHCVVMCGDVIEVDSAIRPSLRLAAMYFAEVGVTLHEASQELPTPCPLTDRQIECLRWVGEGKSDWEIGAILNISENTVHRHVEMAKQRLQVSTRVQAVVVAWRSGWLYLA